MEQASAQGFQLAQNDSIAQEAIDQSPMDSQAPQDAGAGEYEGDAASADYEAAAAAGSAASADSALAQGQDGSPGAQSATTTEQPMMEASPTPPPPTYDGSSGAAPSVDQTSGDAGSQPTQAGVAGSPDDQPQPQDPSLGQPGAESQVATTSITTSLTNQSEPPLGLLPIIVFGLATMIGLILYLSRRGKNWQEISESMRMDEGGTLPPESAIVTQFSEIHEGKGSRHSHASAHVSNFE